jgi:DNA-binding GntR family transcriptional regulator
MPNRSELGRLNLGVDARTLAASITNTLRGAILSGQLAPGEALGQEALAQRFGVSRIPVRESLKQLEAEGLVEARPHRGAVVARLTVEELDELYGIVWALELLAARTGVPRMTDEQIATMGALLERLGTTREPHEWYATSVQFHMQMVAASGLERVIRIVGECRRNIGRYVIDPALFRSRAATWLARNRALYEACRRRDADAAVAALEVMRTVSTADVRDALRAGASAPATSRKRKVA